MNFEFWKNNQIRTNCKLVQTAKKNTNKSNLFLIRKLYQKISFNSNQSWILNIPERIHILEIIILMAINVFQININILVYERILFRINVSKIV